MDRPVESESFNVSESEAVNQADCEVFGLGVQNNPFPNAKACVYALETVRYAESQRVVHVVQNPKTGVAEAVYS